MIVIMDMSSGTRLDDEESLPFVHECLATEPAAQPTPQLGLQLAVPEPAPRSVLRAPAQLAAMWLMANSEEIHH